jgi:hypothetical protein
MKVLCIDTADRYPEFEGFANPLLKMLREGETYTVYMIAKGALPCGKPVECYILEETLKEQLMFRVGFELDRFVPLKEEPNVCEEFIKDIPYLKELLLVEK